MVIKHYENEKDRPGASNEGAGIATTDSCTGALAESVANSNFTEWDVGSIPAAGAAFFQVTTSWYSAQFPTSS